VRPLWTRSSSARAFLAALDVAHRRRIATQLDSAFSSRPGPLPDQHAGRYARWAPSRLTSATLVLHSRPRSKPDSPADRREQQCTTPACQGLLRSSGWTQAAQQFRHRVLRRCPGHQRRTFTCGMRGEPGSARAARGRGRHRLGPRQAAISGLSDSRRQTPRRRDNAKPPLATSSGGPSM